MDGFVKRFSCGVFFFFFFHFSVLCIWNRTFLHPPPPFPPNPEGTLLPPSQTSSSFSKREIPRCTWARSLQKELGKKTTNQQTKKQPPPQKSPPHQRVQSSRKRSNWDGNYELTSANYYFRTWICHASHLKSFSRVAIQFWPYSNITHRTAVLPCQKRNYRKPVWRIFYMITEIDLVGWLWSNSIVTLQL